MPRNFPFAIVLFTHTLIGLLAPSSLFAQYFTNQTEYYGIAEQQPPSSLGVGITVYDYDHDGWDDFFVIKVGTGLIYYHNVAGTFVRHVLHATNQHIQAVVCGDYDNDGDTDLFITGRIGPNRLLRNDGGLVVTNVTVAAGVIVPGAIALCAGASFGDYDSDGWLDLYVCRYSAGNNHLFRNNGNGTFTDVAVAVGVNYGSAASFLPVFIDLDFDGDQDISLIVDRDPIDALYINDGNNQFTDIAPTCGFDYDICSMSNSWEDYDHDGDYDVYITNEQITGNYFFQNDGSLNFTNIAAEQDVQVFSSCWGAVWIDADNDTWSDLYVCKDFDTAFPLNRFFINANGQMEEVTTFADNHVPLNSISAAKGDFNNDGFYDLVVGENTNGFIQLYESNGSANNWVKVTMEGTVSNRDGFGAWLEYWHSGQRFIKAIVAGENYFSQNSQHVILPLGTAAQIDSLRVHWPSGVIDHYPTIPAGVRLPCREGEVVRVFLPELPPLCPADTLALNPGDYFSIQWNTSATDSILSVIEAGEYSAYVLDSLNQLYFTDTLTVIDALVPAYSLNTIAPTCADSSNGSIELTTDFPFDSLQWSTSSTQAILSGLAAGVYSFAGQTADGCVAIDSATLVAPDSIQVEIGLFDPLCFAFADGAVEITTAAGGTLPYLYVWSNESGELGTGYLLENLSAGNYTVLLTDAQGCGHSANAVLTAPAALAVSVSALGDAWEAQVSGGTPPYTVSWPDGSDALTAGPFELGEYVLSVLDANGCETSVLFEVLTGVAEWESSSHCLVIRHRRPVWLCDSSPASFSVVDEAGRVIFRGNGFSHFPELPAGGYVLILDFINQSQTAFRILIP